MIHCYTSVLLCKKMMIPCPWWNQSSLVACCMALIWIKTHSTHSADHELVEKPSQMIMFEAGLCDFFSVSGPSSSMSIVRISLSEVESSSLLTSPQSSNSCTPFTLYFKQWNDCDGETTMDGSDNKSYMDNKTTD